MTKSRGENELHSKDKNRRPSHRGVTPRVIINSQDPATAQRVVTSYLFLLPEILRILTLRESWKREVDGKHFRSWSTHTFMCGQSLLVTVSVVWKLRDLWLNYTKSSLTYKAYVPSLPVAAWNSREQCQTLDVFFYTFICMIKYHLYIRHIKRTTAITNNNMDQL